MNFKRNRDNEEPEIILIPMIDVLLVVLIFLMVTTTYSKFSELQINLPQAAGDTSKQKPHSITVSVDAAGNYAIDDKSMPFSNVSTMASQLKQAAGGSADTVIIINADAKATHQSVINIMEAGREAGLTRITFATEKPQ